MRHGAGELGSQIRQARQRAGLSQEQAAVRIGVSVKAYRAWELHREPRPQRLREIARAFDLPEATFLGAPAAPIAAVEERLATLGDALHRHADDTAASLGRVEAELLALRELVASLVSERRV